MSNHYRCITSAFVVSLFALSSFAQETDKNVNQKNLGENGLPNLITFKENTVYKSSDFKKIFQDQLGLKQNESFSKIKTESDGDGFTHEKFQLFHQGLKVEFATYMMHSKNGKLSSMSGEFYNIGELKTTPAISSEDALNRATSQIGATKYLWENQAEADQIGYQKPQGELLLLPLMPEAGKSKTSTDIRLAYKFDIYATSPVSRGDVYVDAITGEVLFYNATIKHLGEHAHGITTTKKGFTKNIQKPEFSDLFKNNSAFVAGTAATRYSGSQSIETTLTSGSYKLKDATRGLGVDTYNMQMGINYNAAVDFSDVDNNWTASEFNNTAKDNAALDAHWAAEKTYDFFKVTFNRNSYDNSGAKIKSYVHFDLVEYGYPNQDNAFWDGSRMTYGDGTSLQPLTSIDVAAHEIGHAICTYSANLAYQRESGAMNEGFSDIWAACVEYYAAPNKQTWVLAEDIGGPIRSFSNPNSKSQPDTYGGTYWKNVNCGTPTQNNDYCGVHTNSGVLNHWFYILSIGKSGTNDIGNAFNVTGITIEKAGRIAYRLETVYLSANSTYADARTHGIQSAIDLFGAGSAEVIATTNAWYAVGIGAAYVGPSDTIAPSAPTSLAASGTTQTTTNLSWTASTDNVGVTGYDVYRGTTLLTTVTGTSYTASGLTASTAYSFSVKAKDAAGNISAASNIVNVTTLAPVADTVAPSAPSNLTASGTTQTSTNLSWTASTDNVGVTGYDVYRGTTFLTTVTGTSYTATGLTAATAYTFSVNAKDAAGNISASSNVVNVTTSSTSITYCNSKGNSVADEYIDYVSIGGISNATGANAGYGNFTNLVGNLSYGANPLIVSAGFTGLAYTEYWAIWIDFNKNGVFETSEKVESGSSSSSANLTGTVNVPTTALAGTTRMRVSMKYNAAPTACETFAYGEVEDYTVNIGGSSITEISTNAFTNESSNIYDFTIYPNPVVNTLHISLQDDRTTSFKIYNLLGQEVKSGNASQTEINVSNLNSGIYIFEMNDGQKTITKKFIKK